MRRVVAAVVLMLGMVIGCAEQPTAPVGDGDGPAGPMLVGEPSNFVGSGCVVDSVDANGDYWVHWDFTWTSGQTSAWQMAGSFTSTGLKIPIDSAASGTSYQVIGTVTPPGINKNRWFWLRSGLTGGGWSNWVGASNNPINVGGTSCML